MIQTSLKLWYFLIKSKLSLSWFLNKKTCWILVLGRLNENYKALNLNLSVMAWSAISKHKVIFHYFCDPENVTRETYKRLSRYDSFPELRECPQPRFFNRILLFPTTQSLYVSTWDKSSRIIWWIELVRFHVQHNYWRRYSMKRVQTH